MLAVQWAFINENVLGYPDPVSQRGISGMGSGNETTCSAMVGSGQSQRNSEVPSTVYSVMAVFRRIVDIFSMAMRGDG